MYLVSNLTAKLRWNEHVDMAIKGANVSLYGIRTIKKYFTLDETRNMITAIYFTTGLKCGTTKD